MATCMWHTWFEHVHVKEGPRDAGKETDWDFEVGGPSYNTLVRCTKNVTEDGRMELTFLRSDSYV